MPAMIAPSPTASFTVQPHLFGATGPLADAIAREGEQQRERTCAEARRISGNFYVDRLVGHIRSR